MREGDIPDPRGLGWSKDLVAKLFWKATKRQTGCCLGCVAVFKMGQCSGLAEVICNQPLEWLR